MQRNVNGSIVLTSRAHQILAEAYRYRERGWLPATIRRKEVLGYDGDYVVGKKLVVRDGAEVTVLPNQFHVAAEWLIRRKWDRESGFGEAWAKIRSALYGPEFFSPSRPLPLRPSKAADCCQEETSASETTNSDDNKATPPPDGQKLREIVIRCAGPSKRWIIWLEIVFVEWSDASFSVYARTGEAVPGGGVSLGLLPRTAGQLSWREVLDFVQAHDLAAVSANDPQPIEIYGVEPCERDAIAAAMMRQASL